MGIPCELVSENGPQFCSKFQEFAKSNGIRHLMGAPYHTATNGLTERMVQIKKAVKKSVTDPGTLQTRLSRFIMTYWITT